jgi:uncharacterized surface protein with fasciclin (FAS1) repeats
MTSHRSIAAVAAATTLVVGGAGATGAAASSSHSGAQPAAQATIVQTAVAAGQFKTLAALLKEAGLATTLEGKGPYTVFAPTDAAFAKVPKGTLQALAENKSQLRTVLLYHVAKGRLTAATIAKRHTIRTLNGQSLPVSVRGGVVTVGGARVLKANVNASNGVIHVINGVLIPR